MVARLQYSMAIVRLVNGIADGAQKGRVASSVANLASSAGALPCLKWVTRMVRPCGLDK